MVDQSGGEFNFRRLSVAMLQSLASTPPRLYPELSSDAIER